MSFIPKFPKRAKKSQNRDFYPENEEIPMGLWHGPRFPVLTFSKNQLTLLRFDLNPKWIDVMKLNPIFNFLAVSAREVRQSFRNLYRIDKQQPNRKVLKERQKEISNVTP
jgi:hypothetical protein